MITADSTMRQVLEAYPGAQRALFARYHIGGCSSCAFSPEETLEALCRRNEGIPVGEMIAWIEETHDADRQILLEPGEFAAMLASGHPPKVIDVRTREEHEAVAIPGSLHFTQDLIREIFGTWDKETVIVLHDHTGNRVLDAAAYLIGHGFVNARALRGGIDAYSAEADASIPRYRVEME
jgi:rhodanese-related sulfurtransferase